MEAGEFTGAVGPTTDGGSSDHVQTVIPAWLERMVKLFKTHRCALDFDSGFCKGIFKQESEEY